MQFTSTELETLEAHFLPERNTPSNILVGLIAIGAVNTATSVNAVTALSASVANAVQLIRVG